MSKKYSCSIEDLFDLFEDSLSPADVLSSKMMAQISTAITKERIKLGMNQKDFATHIGATQSLVSRWEHGDYNFSIRKIAEIASRLNLDINISMVNMKTYKIMEDYEYLTTYIPTNIIYYSGTRSTPITNKTYETGTYSKMIYLNNKKEEYSYATVR